MDRETHDQIQRLLRQAAHERAGRKAVVSQLGDLMNRFQQERIRVKKLEQWVERAAQRIKYIEDIPGKRIPYLLNFVIEIPSGVQEGPQQISIANQQFFNTQLIPMDGPFVATHYMGALQLKTYSLGPTQERPQDAAAGEEVITPLTGRFRPLASTNDNFSGAYIGPGTQTIAAVNTPRPGALDFLWELEDEGSRRARQNQIPQPSRYLFSEVDRPYYLAVSDFYERGSVIRFNITPTREMDLIEMAYVAYNGISGGEGADITGNANDRRVFASGGTLYFTMGGYKILQAQTPAV
ncbi:MAG TPA: hypothetical protein VIY27_10415 [Myxococcota bacterium]